MSTVAAPNPHGYTEEDLAMLTEAERAGLLDTTITDDFVEEEETTADDKATPAVVETSADDDPDDIIEDDFVEGDSEEEAIAAIAAAAAAAKPEDKPTPEDKASALPQAEQDASLPIPVEPLAFPNVAKVKADVAAADAKVAELDTKIEDLERKYDDGELDLTEAAYRAQLAELRTEQRTAVRAAGKLENAVADAESQLNASLTTWSRQVVPGFLADKPDMFRNAGSTAFKIMDEHVRAEQGRTGVAFDPQHLKNAYEATVEQLRNEGLWPAHLDAKPNTKPATPEKAADAKVKRPSPPPTLANIPASEIEGASGEDPMVENLNRLAMQNPAKFEKALAALTPAQRDAYMLAGSD